MAVAQVLRPVRTRAPLAGGPFGAPAAAVRPPPAVLCPAPAFEPFGGSAAVLTPLRRVVVPVSRFAFAAATSYALDAPDVFPGHRALVLPGPPPAVAQHAWPTLRRALDAALKADAGIAAVVGANVWPVQVPQPPIGGYPALVYEVLSNERGHTLDGPDGTSTARVRVTSWAKRYGDDDDAALAVLSLLDGFSGLLAGVLPVLFAFQAGEVDGDAPPVDAGPRGLYSTFNLYTIQYREPVNPANRKN